MVFLWHWLARRKCISAICKRLFTLKTLTEGKQMTRVNTLDEYTAEHLEDWVYLRSGSLNCPQLHQDILTFCSEYPDMVERGWPDVRPLASIH